MNIFHFLAAVYDSKTAELFSFARQIQPQSNFSTNPKKSRNMPRNMVICR